MTHEKVGVLSKACSFFIPFAAKVCWGWSVWNVPWMSKLMKHQKDHGHMPWMIFAPSSWRNETFSESLLLQRSFWADRRCPRLGVLQCPCLSAASSELQPTPNYLTTCPVTTSLRHVVLQVLFNIFKMMLLLFTVTWFLAACGPEEKSKVKPLESCSASIFLCPMPGYWWQSRRWTTWLPADGLLLQMLTVIQAEALWLLVEIWHRDVSPTKSCPNPSYAGLNTWTKEWLMTDFPWEHLSFGWNKLWLADTQLICHVM